uniref:Oxysterol-binding protein n=2 Tax=Panagrolaimus sp. JU765 TaxID=591449 RepID=A0AC34QUQ9_9BILA
MSSVSSSSCTSDNGCCEVFTDIVKSVQPGFVTRSELPSHAVNKNIGIWTVLKHAIGKDLSRFSIPIVFNEPLSMLQRLAEYMEYHELIAQATFADEPSRRIELVTAFAMSTLASTNVRMSKPFNPLLYETFELCRPELGFEFVAEQVSHHPPISAFYARGPNYEFSGTVEPKIKFWGRSIEVHPNASIMLKLLNWKETYTWQAASCSVHNIIIGRMYMCLSGPMIIKCAESDLQVIVKFRGAGKNGPDVVVTGDVMKTSTRQCLRTIFGNWTEFLGSTNWSTFQANKHTFETEFKSLEKRNLHQERVVMFREGKLLWRVYKRPPKCKDYYYMTYFSLALNEAPTEPNKLPRTDSRLRPDIRLLESGDVDRASREKERLETKQRSKVKIRSGKEITEPKWFTVGKENGRTTYTFNGKYFERDFAGCDDIF